MREFEKMLKGEIYDANYDKEILKLRLKAKDICFEYNNTMPSDEKKKLEIIDKLQIKHGKNIEIVSPFYCDYGFNIEVGENFYANHKLIILDGAKVKIGKNVFIAPNVTISTAGHPIDYKRRNEGLEYAKSVEIGDNVWIGAGVIINPGVKIGDNTVIGSGSVVTKDIGDNTVAFGNPCREIRKISEDNRK
ncbi:sugar O-acetyltransferase [Anaerococcus sp. AGMB00486]|uniref:Acetyltransferase n=2 Tax=Anaerococcus TaxID=165779 RepID=A0ABX2NAT9_9FIRM|nr:MULTISPECIES: sugar O-acetyltransferase [Anaerococcus]MSS78007.1 sugar O-acetyltransferase [Anaerococcus porci]NVF11806.1 sugar O-acetyltransferase [Anaerococcus faecalis]